MIFSLRNCSRLGIARKESAIMKRNLLRETFDRARKENGGLTSLGMRFYARLFEKYPAVRPLFTTPPEQQHKKLMASIGAIVTAAENPTTLMPYLHAMGIRHLKYKTENAHYPAVAENLVAVLAEHLSKEGEWTEEMKQTWEDALTLVATIMIEAANDPASYQDELAQAGYAPDGFRHGDPAPWEFRQVAASAR
jgi:hemoglobin-like flavoprotein